MSKDSAHQAHKPSYDKDKIIVKKYPNRRLYDTHTSSYITLDDLCEMVKRGVDFVVVDAKTDEDLTRQVLTQIIFEQESKGYSLLPIKFLRSIISFYDGKMQQFIPPYLEASMESFSQNQDKMREFFTNKSTAFSPFTQFEEIGKQNMALFQQAFSIFNPFGAKTDRQEDESTMRRTASGKKS
jgi:polyhydroxyalkanoate synthesis repressor PhaR